MNFINPNFKIDPSGNIFDLRSKDYNKLLSVVGEMLKPVEDIGFQIVELRLKESKFSSGELNKTLKKNLIIRLQKGTTQLDLSMFIPKLIDHNYIVINGRRKIPLFQLFDIPLVTRGESIKLRTNVATLMLFEDKEMPFIKVSFMSKKVPLCLLMFAYFGPQELNRKYDFKNLILPTNIETMYDKYLVELKTMFDESRDFTQDDFILEVGRTYHPTHHKSKGEDIIHALDIIPKIDLLSAQFFHTDSVLEELEYALKYDGIDDTLFTNKRIRCFEYMIYAKISKVIFDLCYSNRTSRQPKFNVNSTQILSDCNVSDIVQFDFSINPLEELTKLSRCSLLGPGGFARENVPKHLRDISPTMFGRVCPVDTPDRENCGILQSLPPNAKLDNNMRFKDEILEKQPISMSVSMVPFLEHDDQTRLQMSSSQMRQAIMLKEFDEPMISSGCEGLYSTKTQFTKIAKDDGDVVYRGDEFIIILYKSGEVDVIDIRYRKIYVGNLDILQINVKQGDKVKKGDIIAESKFCKDGKIQFGKNLLTAVMVHYGNNYEDGIVISDRLVKEDVFTSIHYKDLSFSIPQNKVLLTLNDKIYQPLPDIWDKIQTGEPYAIMKELSDTDLYSVFNEEIKLEADRHYIITDINVYANNWNEEIPEYRDWIESTIEKQNKKEKGIKEILETYMQKDEAATFIRDNGLDKFSYVGKYKDKRERINGVFVEMYGLYFRKIRVGDKIANRHGNKGVISAIIEHDKMPQLEDGRHVDICINPLGIISRMNIGQLYELHLSMSLQDLKKQLIDLLPSQSKVKKYLLDYISIIDNTENGWYSEQFKNQLPKNIDENFINKLTIIQPPFESVSPEKLKQAMKYTNTPFTYKIYDPISKETLLNKVAVGYMNKFRMVHIAEDRLAARGIGAYARRTLQPLGGRRNKGGQRMGEMESACLIGHDASINLHEFLTTKSDCIDLKNRYIKECIGTSIDEEKIDDQKPESVKLLNSYLTVLGVDHERD